MSKNFPLHLRSIGVSTLSRLFRSHPFSIFLPFSPSLSFPISSIFSRCLSREFVFCLLDLLKRGAYVWSIDIVKPHPRTLFISSSAEVKCQESIFSQTVSWLFSLSLPSSFGTPGFFLIALLHLRFYRSHSCNEEAQMTEHATESY